jgi:N-acyl-D-aspartate/D-glutamate deacylase
MKYDRIIKNGMIVDGTRQPRFRGDIAIKNGVIAAIGRIDSKDAPEVLDATGLVVAPGFVDLHTHYDAQLFWDPYCSLSGWHGVTSVVIGNCGFGFAPVKTENRERAMLSMTRIEAIPYTSMKLGLPWDWETYPQFLDSVDRAPKAINILPYVAAGPLLVWVMGLERAKAGVMPTDAEHAEMRRVFAEALEAGGCGWSAQRTPPEGGAAVQRDYDGTPMVTDIMHDETCFELCKVMRDRNEGFAQVLYQAGNLPKEMEFYEKMAEISGRPILMNVVTPLPDKPEHHRQQLAWLTSCRERGLRVIGQGNTCDAGYTFTLEDWNLFDDLDCWAEVTFGTPAERKVKMADPVRRAVLRANVPNALIPLERVVVVGPKLPKNQKWLDHTIKDIADQTGRHMVDIFLDMAVEEDLKTEFFGLPPMTSIPLLKEIVDDPWVVFGVSDGGAHTRFLTSGRYATEHIIKIRDYNMCSLEEMHWRLSTLPAMVAGFRDRGTLVVGAPADIVVYDHANLKILPVEIAHDFPGNEWRRIQKASGYRYILVNGEVTIRDDQQTNTFSGKLLRHGSARAAAARGPGFRSSSDAVAS